MGIAESIINAIKDGLGLAVSALQGDFGGIATSIASFVLRTPVPLNSSAPWSFSAPPSGTVWAALFPIYQEVQYFVIAIFALGLGLTFTTGAVRNSAETRKQIRRLAFYFPLAYWWWWIGGWFLKFNQVLTNSLVGGSFLSGMGSLLDVVGVSILIVVFIYVFGSSALIILGVVYLSRWFVIHIYMVVMPVLFCLKALPFEPIQGFSDSLITKFFPLVLTTVPVAILFRIAAQLIASSPEVGGSGIITGLFAIVTLILAAILPKFVFQFSGQIQSSVQTAASTAVGAGTQAAAMTGSGGSGSAQQTLSGSSANTGTNGGSGSAGSSTSGNSESGSLRHEPDLNFSNKNARRGAKGVKAAAKGGKKTASATKKGALGTLSGAAKAHEKGKQSDMPTATATAGSAAWQSGEAATSKGKDVATSVSDSVRSGWENQVKRRVQNAREAGQSTVEQARQEARESSDWAPDSKSESEPTDGSVDDPETEVNTAPGEPAMDATQSTSTGAFEEMETDTDSADAGSADVTTGAVSQGETYDRNSSDTTVGGFAGSSSTASPDTEPAAAPDNSSTPSESVSPESMVDTTGDGTHTVDEQQAEQAAANIANDTDLSTFGTNDQDDPIYDELGIEDNPDGEQEYTAVQATRHKLREQADDKGGVPYSDRNSPGGTNEYRFDSGGGDASDNGQTTDATTGLSDTEQAVQNHLQTNEKSPTNASHAAVAGEMMRNDQIDDPGDVEDALDTLRKREN